MHLSLCSLYLKQGGIGFQKRDKFRLINFPRRHLISWEEAEGVSWSLSLPPSGSSPPCRLLSSALEQSTWHQEYYACKIVTLNIASVCTKCSKMLHNMLQIEHLHNMLECAPECAIYNSQYALNWTSTQYSPCFVSDSLHHKSVPHRFKSREPFEQD